MKGDVRSTKDYLETTVRELTFRVNREIFLAEAFL
jgi:hypothetical protein